jgi:hypothetical protein
MVIEIQILEILKLRRSDMLHFSMTMREKNMPLLRSLWNL